MPTKIEWAEEVWNPITGCTPVSEGCQNCYAKRMAIRLRGRFGYPEDEPFKVNWRGDYVAPSKGYPVIEEPLHWKKPRMNFVCSMGDLCHKDIPGHLIHTLIKLMKWDYKHHIFLLLTKRSDRMRRIWMNIDGALPDNIWLGVSVENQKRADERIPILLQIPAAKRFVSIEPMLGPVDLRRIKNKGDEIDCLSGYVDENDGDGCFRRQYEKLDWVILGGESGPGARPMHPDWVRSVRDQCQDAGVPFFFKQWGEWIPYDCEESTHWMTTNGDFGRWEEKEPNCKEAICIKHVGKKAAGRLLDGREWNERPND